LCLIYTEGYTIAKTPLRKGKYSFENVGKLPLIRENYSLENEGVLFKL
jgi:hypothetical protein